MVNSDRAEADGLAETLGAMESFSGFGGFVRVLRADLRANERDPKSRLIVTGFRLCQWVMGSPQHPRLLSVPFVAAYRFWTEFGIGMELRPKTRIGAGLTIFHGYGLVVNDGSILGKDVVLRNGVVIGHASKGGRAPRILSGVEIGASALVIGDIEVGESARIGAGAVVVKDVAPADVVVGNPARSTRR